MFGEKSVLRLFHIQVFCPLVSTYRIFLLCTTSVILLTCLKSSSFRRTGQNICTSSFKPALAPGQKGVQPSSGAQEGLTGVC